MRNQLKRIIAAALALCVMLSMNGCSQQDLAARIFPAAAVPAKEVTIVDGQMKTVLNVADGMTVEQVLAQAEITVDENCQVEPELRVLAGDEIKIGRPMKVSLYMDDKKSEITVYSGKVADVLAQAPRRLTSADLVDQDEDAYVYEGMEIRVVHQNKITIQHDGQTDEVFTAGKTVADVLTEQNLTLGADDRIEPEMTEKIAEGTSIVIKRVTFQEEKKTVDVPYETTTKNNSSMAAGTTKTIQKGQNGSKDVTYKITLVDGEEESREEISSVVTKEPVNAIVEKGTKQEEKKETQAAKKKKKGKHVVRKEKLYVECDGTVVYKYYYSDGSSKLVYK